MNYLAKWILVVLSALGGAPAWGQTAPVISPSVPPVVAQGSTYQFSATGGSITWSLVSGSVGSINSSTGLYTAPSTIPVKQSLGGCAEGAPNHVYNTNISGLPKNSGLTTYLNANAATQVMYPYSGGSIINYLNSSTPTESMVFAYTPANNGTYQIPTRAQGVEQEAGYDIWPFANDRHILMIRPGTCLASEIYNLYPAGAVDQIPGFDCPTCTSQSGLSYNSVQSLLPANGTTDAAGLPIQIGILKIDELRYALATSGAITHALRVSMSNAVISPSNVWPATQNTPTPWGQIPYGTRIRLKSSYTHSSANPYVPILLTQLKNYGIFVADGGQNYAIYGDSRQQPDATILAAFAELNSLSDLSPNFEVVDESALNNSDGTALVAPGNAAAPVFAAVVATNTHGSATMQIALQGLAIDIPESAVFIQAGAPARQLAAYSSGGPNTGFSWAISPSIGSITSGGLYTPPTSATSPTAVTATVTSTANAALFRTTTIYVLPNASSTVRMLMNSNTANYTDSGANVWYAMAGPAPMYPMLRGGILYDNGSLYDSPTDPSLYSPVFYNEGDMFFNASLPPGNYKVTLKLNSGEAGANQLGIDFETQHVVVQHDLDVAATAGGVLHAYDLNLPLTVAADGIADIRLRENTALGWHSFISSIQIAPDASAASVKIERGVNYGQTVWTQANSPYNYTDNITRSQTRQFYAQGWYEANTVNWSVLSGPGSINSSGVYTAPSTPPTGTQTVTVKATSTINAATDTISFNFVFGTMVVSPTGIQINRQLPQTFTVSINGSPYTNVTWSIVSGPGSINSSTGVYTPPSSLAANTSLTVQATSTDDPTQSITATVTVMRYAIPVRIGGGIAAGSTYCQAFTDINGNAWAGQSTYGTPPWYQIAGTMETYSVGICTNCASLGIDPYIVACRRYGPTGTEFDLNESLPNGTYTVTMYWMGTDPGAIPSDDVYVQGTKVLSAFNSVTAAEGDGLVVTRSFPATVSDTTLTLRFVGVGGGSTFVNLNAVSVLENSQVTTPRSVSVSSGNPTFTLPAGAPWSTIDASTQPMRWEMRVHNFGSQMPEYGPGVGALAFNVEGSTALVFNGSANSDTINNNGPYVTCCMGQSDVLIRAQRDVVNSRYILEVCGTDTGACLTDMKSISSFGPTSWVGLSGSLNAGYSVAFLRWFSSVVPVGTPIPIAGAEGDLGDWEFEGNLNDSSGHGLNMSGGVVAYSPTPTYPPVCNAGAPQAFRAGYTAQLDGTGSMPLDGNVTLTYAWQQMSGPSRVVWPRSAGRWPPQPTMSGQNTSQPTISGMVAGSYTFQLTVTDSSQQSSVCTVNHGAVVTDDNGVVITNNPAVDTLLGPMIRYGANPWPWFDDRHKADADVQIANMDTYYGAWWDVADAGTVSVTVSSNPYGPGSVVTGVGTTFTTTFCQGPSAPTVPISGIAIVIWYPTNNPLVPGETGRRMATVSSCQSDTQLTLTVPWTSDVSGGSGLSYSDNSNYGTWAYNMSPANYYDNVAAFYALYYRSGIIDYLNAARKLADRFWRCPETDRGTSYNGWGTGGGWPNRSASLMGLVLRALDGRPEMWTGMNKLFTLLASYTTAFDEGYLPALWDVREQAYQLAMMSYCALYDTDATMKSTCQSWISGELVNVYAPAKMADGSWTELVAHLNSWGTTPATTVTLTHGSTAVVGNGTSWNCSYFPASGMMAAAWFLPTSARPTSNAGGDSVAYMPTCTDGQHLVLDRPYEGTSGATHGWAISIPAADTPYVGYGSYVYMEGLLSMAFDFASKALATSDPTNSALARGYNSSSANWIKTYGYEASQKSVYYGAQFVNCQAPIQETPYSPCTSGWTGSGARVINAEAIRGLMAAYAYSKDPSLHAFIDVLYNAMWAEPTTCPTGSVTCVPDGVYLNQFDPGGVDISGIPPGGAAPKWFGQMWGVSSLSSWPATRLGGTEPNGNWAFYIGFHLSTVPGAASVQVVATGPDGQESYTACNTSPCAVVVNGVPGARLVELQYLSPSGGVLARSELPVIQAP